MRQEVYYYTGCGNKLKDENITSESTSTKLAVKDEQFAKTLLGEGGALASGMLPAVEASSEKNLLETVTQEQTEKQKQPPRKKTEAEKAEPKTVLESATKCVKGLF